MIASASLLVLAVQATAVDCNIAINHTRVFAAHEIPSNLQESYASKKESWKLHSLLRPSVVLLLSSH